VAIWAKLKIAGSIPVSPAKNSWTIYVSGVFYFLTVAASRYLSTGFDVTFFPAHASLYNEICYTLFEVSAE
jgi:hypothetical protein